MAGPFLMTVVMIVLDYDRHYNCQDPILTREVRHARLQRNKLLKSCGQFSTAASRLMREWGISGAGVDGLTKAAGMTHGSL
jgi:hypothetical protein